MTTSYIVAVIAILFAACTPATYYPVERPNAPESGGSAGGNAGAASGPGASSPGTAGPS